MGFSVSQEFSPLFVDARKSSIFVSKEAFESLAGGKQKEVESAFETPCVNREEIRSKRLMFEVRAKESFCVSKRPDRIELPQKQLRRSKERGRERPDCGAASRLLTNIHVPVDKKKHSRIK